MIGDFASKQFLIFLLTGGTAAAVNFGSRILYNLAVGYSSAIILAYLTGMVTAFVLAKLFVFRRSTQSLQRSALIAAHWLVAGGAAASLEDAKERIRVLEPLVVI